MLPEAVAGAVREAYKQKRERRVKREKLVANLSPPIDLSMADDNAEQNGAGGSAAAANGSGGPQLPQEPPHGLTFDNIQRTR